MRQAVTQVTESWTRPGDEASRDVIPCVLLFLTMDKNPSPCLLPSLAGGCLISSGIPQAALNQETLRSRIWPMENVEDVNQYINKPWWEGRGGEEEERMQGREGEKGRGEGGREGEEGVKKQRGRERTGRDHSMNLSVTSCLACCSSCWYMYIWWVGRKKKGEWGGGSGCKHSHNHPTCCKWPQLMSVTHSRKFGSDRDEYNRHAAEEKLHLLHLGVSDTHLTTKLRGERRESPLGHLVMHQQRYLTWNEANKQEKNGSR